jgi:hypothetical protein
MAIIVGANTAPTVRLIEQRLEQAKLWKNRLPPVGA